jgi:hypothetical protein
VLIAFVMCCSQSTAGALVLLDACRNSLEGQGTTITDRLTICKVNAAGCVLVAAVHGLQDSHNMGNTLLQRDVDSMLNPGLTTLLVTISCSCM